jgi:hypothetical protein
MTVALAALSVAAAGCSSNDDASDNGGAPVDPVVNSAPILSAQIGDVVLPQGDDGSSVARDLNTRFTDPDGDTLIFSATSNSGAVQPVISTGGILSLTILDDEFTGAATITVLATDPAGLAVSGRLNALIVPVEPDSIAITQPDSTKLAPGETAAPIDLRALLQPSGDFDDVVFTLTSSAADVLSGRVEEGFVLLTVEELDRFNSSTEGRSAALTIEARDTSGATGQLVFAVNVSGDAPQSGCTVVNGGAVETARPTFLQLSCGAQNTDLLDLRAIFSDLPAPGTLSFSVDSSNPSSVAASLSSGRFLRVALQPTEGDARIGITATDSDGSTAYQSIVVSNRSGARTVPVFFGAETDGVLPRIELPRQPTRQEVSLRLADFVADADPDDLDFDIDPLDQHRDDPGTVLYSYALAFNSAPQLVELDGAGISADNLGELTLIITSEATGQAELLFEVSDQDGDVSQATLVVEVTPPEFSVYVASAGATEVNRRIGRYDLTATGAAAPEVQFATQLAAGFAFDAAGTLYQVGRLPVGDSLDETPAIRVLHNALIRSEGQGVVFGAATGDGVPVVSYNGRLDRQISSAATGAPLEGTAPRNVVVEPNTGLLLVVSTDAANDDGAFAAVQIYAPEAGSASAPLQSISLADLHDEGSTEFGDVWDVVYAPATGSDPNNVNSADDALFLAMTDGRIVRCDQFLENIEVGNPPVCRRDEGGMQVANSIRPELLSCVDPSIDVADCPINLHGIDYVPRTDSLVVSDVGPRTVAPAEGDPEPDVSFDNDGSIYVFHQIGLSLDDVRPNLIIRSAGEVNQSRLGNPVDLVVDGLDIVVAEKANGGGAVLRFSQAAQVGFRAPAEGGVAPAAVLDVVNPEIIQLARSDIDLTDLSDMESRSVDSDGVTIAREATEELLYSADGALATVAVSLDEAGFPQAPVDEGNQVDLPARIAGMGSLTFAGLDISTSLAGYGTVDDGESTVQPGGIIAAQLNTYQAAFTEDDARRIQTLNAGDEGTDLIAPKGLDLAQTAGALIVADFRFATSTPAGSVSVFAAGTEGSAEPLFTTLFDVRRPWDVDYDPIDDRLFVANTDGTVSIFDNYLVSQPNSSTSARVIFPAARRSGVLVKQSQNLHGIVHHRLNVGGTIVHELMLTDVGAAGVDDDGRVLILSLTEDEVANATGAQVVDLQLNGLNEAGAGATDCDLDAGLPANAPVLGDPVDLVYAPQEESLYIAEKLNSAIVHLRLFRDEQTQQVEGFAYSCSPTAAPPEAVQLLPNYLFPATP